MRYKKIRNTVLPILSCFFSINSPVAASLTETTAQPQVLVTVGKRDISAMQLKKAITSSPIATRFNTMNEDSQAMVRGRMLKNLIYSEMLYQEALENKIDQKEEVTRELEDFRKGVLYQHYLLSLRRLIANTDDTQIKQRLKGEADALAAVRAVKKSTRFADLKKQRILALGKQDHLRVFTKPLGSKQRNPEAVVAKGDHIEIHLRDLIYENEDIATLDSEELQHRLDGQVEQQLMVRDANKQGIDVNNQVEKYRINLIREIAMKEKENAWIPNRKVLEEYYQSHPALSTVAEQWKLGQIVSKTRKQAEDLRKRILNGESFYELASKYSIDPYGRQHAGEMGWVRPDAAPEALRNAAKDLKKDEISEVTKTPLGFYLLKVEDRKPGYQKPLSAVASGIRRSLILDKIAEDYVRLSQRYPINWHLPDHKASNKALKRTTEQ